MILNHRRRGWRIRRQRLYGLLEGPVATLCYPVPRAVRAASRGRGNSGQISGCLTCRRVVSILKIRVIAAGFPTTHVGSCEESVETRCGLASSSLFMAPPRRLQPRLQRLQRRGVTSVGWDPRSPRASVGFQIEGPSATWSPCARACSRRASVRVSGRGRSTKAAPQSRASTFGVRSRHSPAAAGSCMVWR